MIRSARFRHTYPDDAGFDDGVQVEPGLYGLAEAVVASLGRRVPVTSEIHQVDYYGWGFDTRFDECRFSNVLNPIESRCYFTMQLDHFWLRALLLKRPRDTFDRYCAVLGEVFREIPGVSGFAWCDDRPW